MWDEGNLTNLMPNWANVDPDDTALVRYAFEDYQDRKAFSVYPQQPGTLGTQYVECQYAALAPDVTLADNLLVGDEFSSALLDYILYRAYLTDDELLESGIENRAQLYYRAYTQNSVFGVA